MSMSGQTINENLMKTGPLDLGIIGVYGCEAKPAGALTVREAVPEGHPCLAKALYRMAAGRDVEAVYVSKDTAPCPGLPLWFGFALFPPGSESMFASDAPGGDSMCIKRTAAVGAATLRDMGKFTPAGRYIVMRPLATAGEEAGELKSILCFGRAGQIRNLGALAHFGEGRAFTPIVAPWGSGCALFVAFPAGMAEKAPRDTAFVGPMVPEANSWFPADMLALSIPAAMAARMAEGYGESFAARKPEVAYPEEKEII